ncbi:MAG: LysR family transcriptional regulator, partial [Firmicutes bacterium]|nr:LysR family transcriptional regulator [Bacillota bacterium]
MKIDRKNDLNLRLLEVFGSVMRNLTTVAAAEELGVSQPAVSNALKALEKQFGFTLFERTNRGLAPTDEARIMFDEIDPVLSMLRGIEEQVRAIRATRKGSLRIAATSPLGQSAIPLALKRFLSGRRDVRISYDVYGVDRVIRDVTTGIKDLGFLLGVDSHPGCDVTPLFKGRMECVLPE